MTRRDVTLLAIAALALAIAATLWAVNRRSSIARHSDFPDGVRWVCLRPDCAHGFTCSLRQLDDHDRAHPGQSLPCPKCGSQETARARECPHCRRFFPQLAPGTRDPKCPHCGKALPRLTGG